MLNRLSPQAPDKIIGLMQAFRADPRSDKVDLGVGVYRDETCTTPIMRAVKAAEQRIWQQQTSKGYVGIEGDPAFLEAIADLTLGKTAPRNRLATVATPGGTGAVRLALDLARLAVPSARVFIPEPSWPNHAAIAGFLGLEKVAYRYYDPAARAVDLPGLLADLGRTGPTDVVVLHGCCHNPTGADLTVADWKAVGEVLAETRALPLVDLAYHGLGDGLEADAEGLRHLAATLPQMLVAISCSKNFGLYRERTGALLALAADGLGRDVVQGNLANLNRQTYAFPPDHGARIVTEILTDPALRAGWEAELAEMRSRIAGLRRALADLLRAKAGTDRFAALASQRGMFSLTGASPEQVTQMRVAHGVYLVGDGRMNLAGLSTPLIPRVADALLAAGL